MGFASYMRSRIWEVAFCAIASSALAFTLYSGFYSCQPLQALPQVLVVVAGCALLSLVFFCMAYRTASAIAGGAVVVVALLAAIAVCTATGPAEFPFDDVTGNYSLAVCLAAGSSALVFLASRRKAGAIALLVVGALACTLVEYLYDYGHVGAYAAFLVGALGLIVLSGYRHALSKAAPGALAFTPISLAALVLATLAIGVSAGVFLLVIEPLNPPAQEVKLIVEHRSQDEVEIRGIGASTADAQGTGGNLSNGDEQESADEAQDSPFDTMQSSVAQMLGMEVDQMGNLGTTTALVVVSFLVLAATLLIALVVLATILARKWLRRRTYARMTAEGGDHTVRKLYLFFLERFRRMKVPQPENLSLAEYARNFSSTFELFERAGGKGEGSPVPPADGFGGSGFGGLTAVYTRGVYGGEVASEDEVLWFEQYYRQFYRNARSYVGWFKYLYLFFRL